MVLHLLDRLLEAFISHYQFRSIRSLPPQKSLQWPCPDVRELVNYTLVSSCNEMGYGHHLDDPHPTCRSILQLKQQQKLLMTLVILVHVHSHVPLSAPMRGDIRKIGSSKTNMVSMVSMHLEKLLGSRLTFCCCSLRSRYNWPILLHA